MRLQRFGVMACIACLTSIPASAAPGQTPGAPTATVPATPPAPPKSQPPTIDAGAAREIQAEARAYLLAQTLLQKEIDALTMQFQRELQKLQAQCAATAGYELDPKGLVCVKTPAPAPTAGDKTKGGAGPTSGGV